MISRTSRQLLKPPIIFDIFMGNWILVSLKAIEDYFWDILDSLHIIVALRELFLTYFWGTESLYLWRAIVNFWDIFESLHIIDGQTELFLTYFWGSESLHILKGHSLFLRFFLTPYVLLMAKQNYFWYIWIFEGP